MKQNAALEALSAANPFLALIRERERYEKSRPWKVSITTNIKPNCSDPCLIPSYYFKRRKDAIGFIKGLEELRGRFKK